MENFAEKEERDNEPDNLDRLLTEYESGTIDRKTYLELLAGLTTIDKLTGLLNRRGIEEALSREIRIHQRNTFTGSPTKQIAVLFVDGDKIKTINDTRGHSKGDAAILHIAQAIKSAASRPTDSAGRLGGDEFLVAMPETDLEGALYVANNLRRQVERNQDFPELSVSIGVALYTGISDQPGLVNQADFAMYKAKNSGGNAIAIHPYAVPNDQEELRKLSDFMKIHHIIMPPLEIVMPSGDTSTTTPPK